MPQPEFVPYRVQTVPFSGDYFRTHAGKVYRAEKINPRNCLSRDASGQLFNVKYENIKEIIEDQGWAKPEVPKVGVIVRVKPDSGMFRKQWFKQFTTSSLFVVIASEPTKVKFVPVGGSPTDTFYTSGVDSVEAAPVNIELL